MSTAALLGSLLPTAAHAGGDVVAPIVVNTTADEINGLGDCSLREAVQSANLDSAIDGCTPGSGNEAADIIQLPVGTFTLDEAGEDNNATDGDLDLNERVTVDGQGPGQTIVQAGTVGGNSSNGIDRVFDVTLGTYTVGFTDMTIRNGLTPGDGGGIHRAAFGPISVVNVDVVGNKAAGEGGGIFINGTPVLDRVNVNGNVAGSDGGGISTVSSSDIGNSTISSNTSGGAGGGIYVHGGFLTNSTVSGNSAAGDGGGAYFRNNSLQVKLTHATVAANRADSDDAGGGSGGGVYLDGNGGQPQSKQLINSLLGDNVVGTSSPSPSDCSGPFESLGGNVIETSPSCATSSPSDVIGLNAALQPLADNGGPTKTHAVNGGPAMDNGVTSNCRSFDQRGFARTADAVEDVDTEPECEAGAYETPAIEVLDADPESESSGSPSSFTVKLSSAAIEDVQFSYQTQDGTAVAGSDYEGETDVGTVSEGSESESILVDLIDDDDDEPNVEDFEVILTGAPKASRVDNVAEGSILDNDVAKATRTVTLNLRKHLRAKGRVTAPGAPKCIKQVPVSIERRKNGKWNPVTDANTGPDGKFSKSIPDKPGKYRAKVAKSSHAGAGGGLTCSKATSTKTHKH